MTDAGQQNDGQTKTPTPGESGAPQDSLEASAPSASESNAPGADQTSPPDLPDAPAAPEVSAIPQVDDPIDAATEDAQTQADAAMGLAGNDGNGADDDPQAPTPDEGGDGDQPGFVERLPGTTVPLILLGVPALAALLSWISPSFYANVIWKYYWGPIKADAMRIGTLYHDNVAAHPGYNVVNTISWAILLFVCVIGIKQLLDHYKQPMNTKLVLGATSWVVVGSIAHVMQDTLLFARPMEYFFITPIIYLLFGLFGIISFVIGQYLSEVAKRAGTERALQKMWLIFAGLVVLYLILWLDKWQMITNYINPIWVAVFALAAFIITRVRVMKTGRIDPAELVITFSIGWFLLDIAYVWSFIQDPWSPVGNAVPSAALVAPGLAALATAAVAGVAYLFYRNGKKLAAVYWNPLNLLIVFGQMVDGFATAIGIDTANYEEKHVLSARVIESFRDFATGQGWEWAAEHPTFLAFAPLKLLLSVVVVYSIDIYAREDVQKHPSMINLFKFAVIMVGIGPGVRDFVRMALGV